MRKGNSDEYARLVAELGRFREAIVGQDPRRTKIKPLAWVAAALAIAVLLGLAAFLEASRHQATSAHSRTRASLVITSSSFSNDGAIPPQYTCDGAGISPNLQWAGAPGGTKSLALVMHDPDAPVDFTHWLAYNIPPTAHELAEGASMDGAMPQGSSEGANGFGRTGYGGPCPPPGAPHHYVVHLYALDSRLDLPAGVTRSRLEAALKPHIIGSGEIVGLYGR